jgi:hypothetical protein
MSKSKKKKLKKKAKRQAELLQKQIQQLEQLEEPSNNPAAREGSGDQENEVDGDGEPDTVEGADCDVESKDPSTGEGDDAKITPPASTPPPQEPSSHHKPAADSTAEHPSPELVTTSITGSISASKVDTIIQIQSYVDVSPPPTADKNVKPKSEYTSLH